MLDTLPGLEEVARFNAGATTGDDDASGTDLSSLMATLPSDGTAATKGTFMKGDKASTGLGAGGPWCRRRRTSGPHGSGVLRPRRRAAEYGW